MIFYRVIMTGHTVTILQVFACEYSACASGKTEQSRRRERFGVDTLFSNMPAAILKDVMSGTFKSSCY